MVCRTRPGQPLLRINSEDVDTGPPNTNKTSIQSSADNQKHNQKITSIASATQDMVAAKSLASYCQYDSVDLETLDSMEENINQSSRTTKHGDSINPSKILDEFDLQYDTTAITSI